MTTASASNRRYICPRPLCTRASNPPPVADFFAALVEGAINDVGVEEPIESRPPVEQEA